VRSLPDGAWSDPLMFEVGGVPSDAELEAAVAVIERYLAQRGATDTDSTAKAPIPQKGAGDVTALQGLVPDAAGTTRGVQGSVASPAGVGVLAENTHPNGFDLQLAGPVPALVNEREWRLASATPQSVNFTNPSGTMSVLVQGQPLITAATDQNTTYSAGNQLALAGTTFGVVEGPGSGLDADTVDGVSAAGLAAATHNHVGQAWSTSGQTGLTVGSDSEVHVGVEGLNTVGVGVTGTASSATGESAIGVQGTSMSVSGAGVRGLARASTGPTVGVYGYSKSSAGAGGHFLNVAGGLLLAGSSDGVLDSAEFTVDSDGDVVGKSYAGDGRPLNGVEPSMFRTFGGDGSDGALVVGNLTEVTGRRQYTTLTISPGGILAVAPFTDGRVHIGVQGRCSILGKINAWGRGGPGTVTPGTSSSRGVDAMNAFRQRSRTALPNCVSGAGGAGGNAIDLGGGDGGGAEGDGGEDGGPAQVADAWKRAGVSGGGTGNRDGRTGYANFADVLTCPGAGGGGGAIYDDDGLNSAAGGGNGGSGGAVVYLECGELEFPASGLIDARGISPLPAQCVGADCSFRDANGGGGGGGGGVILIRARSIISQQGQMLVSGGAGGAGAGFAGTPGGDGASGYADILVVD